MDEELVAVGEVAGVSERGRVKAAESWDLPAKRLVEDPREVVLLQRFVFDPLIRPLEKLLLPVMPPVASAGLPMPTN